MRLTILRHLFTPHHSNNHRARLLQPTGLAVVLGLFVLSQSSLQLMKVSGMSLPGGTVLGYASSITPEQVVNETNAERAKYDLPPLRVNAALTQAALAKANYMFEKDFWAHIAPDGTTPWVFIKNAGYGYSVAGENLARDFGDTDSMVKAWMESPTHKENIINPKYQDIGIAVVDGKLQGVETTLVVQMFGAPVAVLPQTLPGQSSQPKVVGAPQTLPEIAALPETVPTTVPMAGEPVPYELTQTQLSQPQTLAASESLLSPLLITKAIATSMVVLLVALLLYDAWIMHKKQIPRMVGKNWAHVALYSIVLVLVLALSEGKVL